MILKKASKSSKFGLVFLGADFDLFFKFFKFLFVIVKDDRKFHIFAFVKQFL